MTHAPLIPWAYSVPGPQTAETLREHQLGLPSLMPDPPGEDVEENVRAVIEERRALADDLEERRNRRAEAAKVAAAALIEASEWDRAAVHFQGDDNSIQVTISRLVE